VANRLQIVPSRLLNTLVRSDRCVSGRSSQVLSIFVRNVLAFAVFVAFGETEVDDVDVVTSRLCATDQEIIRLDITVNDPLLVHLLNALN